MNKSESIGALSKALSIAQSKIENASKNAANPHFKSKYADLAEVLNTMRPVFAECGLSFVQFPTFDSGVAHVETILMHESGEWLSSVSSAPVSKQDAQGVGSATTYLRRYSLAAMAGIAQEDDDANSAVGKSDNKANDVKDEMIYQALTDKHIDSLVCIRESLATGDYSTAKEAWRELDQDVQIAIWKAPSKGGWFTTKERSQMQSSEWSAA